jgi:hypothetical protein
MNGDRIARLVDEALNNSLVQGYEPTKQTAADLTFDLMNLCADLEGARFDDVYPNVMAWLLRQDKELNQ